MSGYKYGVVGGPGQDLDFLILPCVYYSWSNLKPFNGRGSTAGYQAQSPWRQGPDAFSGVKIVPEAAQRSILSYHLWPARDQPRSKLGNIESLRNKPYCPGVCPWEAGGRLPPVRSFLTGERAEGVPDCQSWPCILLPSGSHDDNGHIGL